MSSFHGVCSTPHGGQMTGILWFSFASAVVCTCYSIASCRLVVLTYESTLGNFEDHFTNHDAAETAETYQVGLGLFTWLLPSFYVDGDDDTVTRAEVGNWREGSCQGYNTMQLDEIMDSMWETVRMLGVFAVLIAWTVFLFSLLLSCLSIANWQRYMLAISATVVAILNGTVLLMLQSDVCLTTGTTTISTTSTNEDAVPSSHCSLDQGGLVAIAGVILWVCSALLAIFFMEPVMDPGMHEQVVQSRHQKAKAKALSRSRKQSNKDDHFWNNNNSSKSGRRRSSSTSNAKRPSSSTSNQKDKKKRRSFSQPRSADTPRTIHSSCSIPSPKLIVDDLQTAEVKQLQKDMVPTKQQQQRKSTSPSAAVANNKSLEARYIPTRSPPAGADDIETGRSNHQRRSPPPTTTQSPCGGVVGTGADYVQEVLNPTRSSSSSRVGLSRNTTASTLTMNTRPNHDVSRYHALRASIDNDLELQTRNKWTCEHCF